MKLENHGTNNVVLLPPDRGRGLNGEIHVRGSNNHLEIGEGSVSTHIQVGIGSNCSIRIGRNCNLGNLFIHADDHGQVTIGVRSTFNGLVRLLLHEAGRITIGRTCLFASQVDVTVSDMHSIIDAATGRRVNPARDVTLEDRVWVGQRAMVLKGAHVRSGSIIGACALVTGKIPANCIAAGTPARVIRTGVTWRHELT
jgi:acetyltransferase-like isoleucine patch superfamily enzyme